MLPIMPLPAPSSDDDRSPLPPSQVDNDSKDKHMLEPASIATHTRAIGMIHPPLDIRNIIEKTASFVAKCGPDYEKIIIGDYAGQQKFNFLNGSDPYHTYYQHRLSELRSHNQATKKTEPGLQADPETTPSAAAGDGNDATKITDPSRKFRPVKKVLEPPEAEQYTIQLPEGITGEELGIIKLTAQFVALKGESFLTGLTSRENKNPQFHFLKPTHNMNMLFKSLLYAYLKVLMPPKGLIDKLKNSVTDITTVLERCWHRLEWERAQEQAIQKAEDELEQERLAMAKIDWHDFVIVETIDFVDDDLPLPVTLEEVKRWSKMPADVEEEIVEPGKEVEMEMDEEEVQLVQEGMRAAALEKNTNFFTDKEENEPRMRIVKNYKRPEERLAAAQRNLANTVVSPITGELIPVNEMSEYMRISLIDPKYREQKERMFAKIRETTLAQDDEISGNIVGLARRRPDIFGTTEEEVSNAVKAEIEKKNDELQQQPIWDGHTGSIGHSAAQVVPQNPAEDQNDGRNLPRPAAPPPRPGVPFLRPLPSPHGLAFNLPCVPPNAQFSAGTPLPRPGMVNLVHYSQQQPYIMDRPPLPTGQSLSVSPPSILVPLPPGYQFTPCPLMPQHGMPIVPLPPMNQGMLPPPPPEEAPPLPEEPEPKRQKLDYLLVPEDQFLAQHPGPVRISVAVPNVDEGNLKGQILEISVESLSESVSSLKEKIAGEIQLPANKQKLSGKAGFFKDSLSLAYYNVGGDEMLSLSLRERSGRKR